MVGHVINVRNITLKEKGNRKWRTAMQKAAAKKVATALGKQRSTDKQKTAARETRKVMGKQKAAE